MFSCGCEKKNCVDADNFLRFGLIWFASAVEFVFWLVELVFVYIKRLWLYQTKWLFEYVDKLLMMSQNK